MRIVSMQVLTCEYCGQKGFRVPDMIKHELSCEKNPTNYTPCIGCSFLKKNKGRGNGYTCLSKGHVMHKKIVQYGPWDGRMAAGPKDSIEMPSECDVLQPITKPKK